MNSGATTERVYDSIKRILLSGAIAPGAKLEPAVFAEEFSSSVTPVREAFHRLTGERLLETRTSEGFNLPHVHEPGLRDLYAWSGQLARLILAAGTVPVMPFPNLVDGERTDDAGLFFSRLATASGNGEHRAAMNALNDRLAVARRVERQILPDGRAELYKLVELQVHGNLRQLNSAIAAYHRRRDRVVPEIVRLLYAQ